MLAVRFSGRWERDNDDDNDNNETFFIDFSPVIFLPLIDYLRAKWVETPAHIKAAPTPGTFADDDELFGDFLRMVDYYGLAEEMYPIRLVPLGEQGPTSPTDNSIVYVATGVDMHDTQMQRYVLQTTNPDDRITSFQILFDQDYHPQNAADDLNFGLGWVDPRQLPSDSVSMDCFRAHKKFTGWYFCGSRVAGGIVTCNREHIACTGVFDEDGSGTTSSGSSNSSSSASFDKNRRKHFQRQRKYRMKFSNIPVNHVPVLGGIGKWRLVNVQMEKQLHPSLLNGDEEKQVNKLVDY